MVARSRHQANAETSASQRFFAGMMALALMLMLVGLMAFCGWVFVQRMTRLYRGAIYPNVYALGIHLGGKLPEEAATALAHIADDIDIGLLVLTDDERRWSYPWSMGGLQIDTQGTAQAAYEVGRGGTWQDRANVWLYYHDVTPRFLFDTPTAHALLAELDAEASQPPVDPTIRLENGEVVVTPGEAGRVLDIPTTLAHLREAGGRPDRHEVPLSFEVIAPVELDADRISAEAEAILTRQITLLTYDLLMEQTYRWALDRSQIATWLYLVPGPGGQLTVDINQYAIRDTLMMLAEGFGDGRGFRYDEAAARVFRAFEAGETQLWLYLTYPEHTYIVAPGDTLTSLSAKFDMPPGLVAEANLGIDIDRLYVGQEIRIPSQNILTPNMPIPGQKIVVSLDEQRTRVYEDGQLLYDWPVSTGIKESPTHRGTFQVLGKHEMAYASQ